MGRVLTVSSANQYRPQAAHDEVWLGLECDMHCGQRLCLAPEACLPAALMLSRKMNTWLSSALNF